jgi:hypothetical protein
MRTRNALPLHDGLPRLVDLAGLEQGERQGRMGTRLRRAGRYRFPEKRDRGFVSAVLVGLKALLERRRRRRGALSNGGDGRQPQQRDAGSE